MDGVRGTGNGQGGTGYGERGTGKGKRDMGNGGREMIKDFTDLRVWQKAKELVLEVYKISKDFPKDERFGLTEQLRRAANSVCANIAEGFERYHTKDKIKFYYNARGSISECKSHLLVSLDLSYLSKDEAAELVSRFNCVGYLLNNMISALSRAAFSRSE